MSHCSLGEIKGSCLFCVAEHRGLPRVGERGVRPPLPGTHPTWRS